MTAGRRDAAAARLPLIWPQGGVLTVDADFDPSAFAAERGLREHEGRLVSIPPGSIDGRRSMLERYVNAEGCLVTWTSGESPSGDARWDRMAVSGSDSEIELILCQGARLAVDGVAAARMTYAERIEGADSVWCVLRDPAGRELLEVLLPARIEGLGRPIRELLLSSIMVDVLRSKVRAPGRSR